jgi:predicted metal-dependent HD superfamily phosphohydrolase
MLLAVVDDADQPDRDGDRRIPPPVDDSLQLTSIERRQVLSRHLVNVGVVSGEQIRRHSDCGHLRGVVPEAGRALGERQVEAFSPASPDLAATCNVADVVVLDPRQMPDQPGDRVGLRIGPEGGDVVGQAVAQLGDGRSNAVEAVAKQRLRQLDIGHGRNDGPVDLVNQWRALTGDEMQGRELVERWSEPHRRYHDVEHLRAVLRTVDELADDAADATAVRLAAWFHDAVYTGRPGEDERASAELAASTLAALGVHVEQVSEVVRLVELTAAHDVAPHDANGAVLCDADFAVLGGDPDEYATYAAAIREEYAQVPEEEFRAGRIAVLERLMARERLFHTATGRKQWEEAAQRNIATELSLLRGGASAS